MDASGQGATKQVHWVSRWSLPSICLQADRISPAGPKGLCEAWCLGSGWARAADRSGCCTQGQTGGVGRRRCFRVLCTGPAETPEEGRRGDWEPERETGPGAGDSMGSFRRWGQ